MNIPGFQKQNSRKTIGSFSEKVITSLGLDIVPETPIYISENNTSHIREKHPDAYSLYYEHLEEIIAYPDYIGIAGTQVQSIEFIKSFKSGDNYVNVAVRATKNGIYYARSMFIIDEGKLKDYLKKEKLVKLDN